MGAAFLAAWYETTIEVDSMCPILEAAGEIYGTAHFGFMAIVYLVNLMLLLQVLKVARKTKVFR